MAESITRISEIADIDTSARTDLCDIMERWGSDKSTFHNYTRVYSRIFDHLRDRKDVRLFEVGLGTNFEDVPSNMGKDGKPGASLRGWREFFPHARIFGADIDIRILFDEDRIQTYYCDQLDAKTIQDMWTKNPELAEDGFDVIIDDGLHMFDANRTFFLNSVHKLRPGGIFVIEDMWQSTTERFWETIQSEWAHAFPDLEFFVISLLRDGAPDNNLLIAQRLK